MITSSRRPHARTFPFTLFHKSAASFQSLLVSVSFHGPAPARKDRDGDSARAVR